MEQGEKPPRHPGYTGFAIGCNSPQTQTVTIWRNLVGNPDPSRPHFPIETWNRSRRAYLQRIYQRSRALYIYGLDARRQALQARGQTLDLQAHLYAAKHDAALSSRNTLRSAASLHQGTRRMLILTRPRQNLSALEAIGSQSRVILRGPRGSGKTAFVRFLASALAERSPDGAVHRRRAPGPLVERMAAPFRCGLICALLPVRPTMMAPRQDCPGTSQTRSTSRSTN